MVCFFFDDVGHTATFQCYSVAPELSRMWEAGPLSHSMSFLTFVLFPRAVPMANNNNNINRNYIATYGKKK